MINHLREFRRLRWFAFVVTLALGVALPFSVARAATGTDVQTVLEKSDVYVSPTVLQRHLVPSNAAQQLQGAVDYAKGKGVSEKLAIVLTYPSTYPTISAAASGLRHYLDFQGVLVVLSGPHWALSSDKLSQSELNAVVAQARPDCVAGPVQCVVSLGKLSADKVSQDQANSNRNALIFWVIVLVILGVIIVFFIRRALGRKQKSAQRLGELRTAASNTLSQADSAVQQIETATNGGATLAAAQRADYDRALALRETAKRQLDSGQTREQLVQANQDAAQAVLAFQGLMRSLGLESEMTNPLLATDRRCFYCGRSDRPPYFKETITDDRGNSMQVDVCSVDHQLVEQGRRPEIATTQYQGAQVPWYAVPGNPWYYSYGGPTWQYWLPFWLGMDVGTWFGGGWGLGGYYGGGPVIINNYGDNDQGQDYASAGYANPSDAAGGDLNAGWGDSGGGAGWGDSSGGGWGDSSGGGWGDSGGGGWGDSGGGGWGDSGGGDWGSGGDSGGGWS